MLSLVAGLPQRKTAAIVTTWDLKHNRTAISRDRCGSDRRTCTTGFVLMKMRPKYTTWNEREAQQTCVCVCVLGAWEHECGRVLAEPQVTHKVSLDLSAGPRPQVLTRFLGNALFSLRPWRVSLDGKGPADELVSMCSAFSMSKASNFSITWDLLKERTHGC